MFRYDFTCNSYLVTSPLGVQMYCRTRIGAQVNVFFVWLSLIVPLIALPPVIIITQLH